MIENKNLAELITKFRKENKKIIHQKELPKLQELALKVVSESYMSYPDLKGLNEKWKNNVYDRISVDLPIETTFDLINYEPFWKRSCNRHYKGVDASNHGNLWKQAYAENYINDLISNFEEGQDLDRILRAFKICKFYIFNLEIPYFNLNFPFNYITSYFTNLTYLTVKYSPKLKEKSDQMKKILRLEKSDKKLEDLKQKYGHIKDEYQRFGIKINDAKRFSLCLKDMDYLINLNLQGNFIDDELIGWLIGGFVTNHTLRFLDLSNNKITDNGVKKLCSLIYRNKTLSHLNLTYNYIGGEGAFALALILKENFKLKSLKVAMNKIDDIYGAKILKALSKNDQLEELDISVNDLGNSSTQALAFSLKSNKTIKYLNLSNNGISLNDELKSAIENSTSLLKLDLRNNKISESDINYIDNTLIKKKVKMHMAIDKMKIR